MAVQSPRKPQFANVRSSESGTVTLTSSDYRWQIFNASAALTVNLPGGGIAGDVWIIENRGSGALTLKSSDASTIATLNQNDVYGTASVQAAPTSSAHWRKAAGFGLAASGASGLINYYNEETVNSTFTFNGAGTTAAVNIKVTRVGRVVTLAITNSSLGTPTGGSIYAEQTTAVSTWARPTIDYAIQSAVVTNNGTTSTTPGLLIMQINGKLLFKRDQANTVFTNSASAGITEPTCITYII